MTDNVSGIVLEIPPTVLGNIKRANDAILTLEASSRKAADQIFGDFSNRMPRGIDVFIKRVRDAQEELSKLKMPNLSAGRGGVGDIGTGASKSANDISALVQSLSRLTDALERNKTARNALKGASVQETEYSRITAELAKQAERYTQLSVAIEQFNQKKKEETSFKERQQNTANLQELQALQQSLPLLREKVALMEKVRNAGQSANNPTLQERRASNELTALNKMYAEEEKASAKKAAQLEKDRQREADAARKSYEQQQKMYEKLFGKGGVQDMMTKQSLAQQKATTLATPQGAIDYAKNARNLREMTEAYKNLKAVMERTTPRTDDWNKMNSALQQSKRKIDEIKKSMGEFKNQASQVGDVAGQLKRTLAATFSVTAITGYINKMIETRAQFELQQVALRAILKDKQEADRIFSEVQQMALQSPFSIMQLTTFTKQLAAYRVEADKLVGTTKMLADVSAGLGVDMQRLILAYGQVKSANYLRACLGRGTKVMMYDGTYKNVEDVVVGDVVMGDDFTPRHVSMLFSGTQQMYSVKDMNGKHKTYRVNENHILTLYDTESLDIVDIRVLDYLANKERYSGYAVDYHCQYGVYPIIVEKDKEDEYFGFAIDGNKRFIIEDGIVTHNTEVRQFTEAGLNIAGELAQYFSELQGKMISVGDVMEMITKRMVRFEDVEEVFKRVTSAGGLFYDMQKKQSETLHGQLQRIKDAMSIMFNEIGKSNQGTISWLLKAIRTLISHWRELAPIVNAAGMALAAYFVSFKAIPTVVAGIKSMSLAMAAVETNTKKAAAAQRLLGATNPYAVLATAAVALIAVVYQLETAQSALNEEFERISEESNKDMWDLIYKYEKNADIIRDSTSSYEDRTKALEDLQQTFRGVLPDQMLEYENILKISDGYKEATEAIKLYAAEKAKESAESAIQEEKANKWNDFTNEVKDLSELLQKSFIELSDASDGAVKGIIGNIMLQIQEETEKGMIKSAEAGYNRFIEILNQRFTGLKNAQYPELQEALKYLFNIEGKSKASMAWSDDMAAPWTTYFDEILNYTKEKQEEFENQYAESNKGLSYIDQQRLNEVKKNYEEQKKAFEDFQRAYENYRNLQDKGNLTNAQGNYTKEGQEAYDNLDKKREALNAMREDSHLAALGMDEITASTNNAMDALTFLDSVQQTTLGGFLQNLLKVPQNNGVIRWAEETEEKLKSIGFNEVQLDIMSLAKKWATIHGVESSAVNKLRIDANTNYTSAANDAKKLSDEAQENITKIEQTALKLIEMGKAAGKAISYAQAKAQAEEMFGNGKTKEELESEKKYYDDLAKTLGYINKSEKKNKKSGKDIWTPRLQLMQKVNKEYEKLLKYYSKEESMARIRQSYGNAVAEAFKGTQWADISKWGGYDAEATIKRLKDLAEKAGKEAKKKILEAAGTLQAEIDIKVEEKNIQKAKDDIQNLFDNYELSKTLKGLGLNIDLTFLVGGKPTDLAQVRAEVEKRLNTAKNTQGEENLVKAYEEYLRKVTDMENKEQVERLKNYGKYLIRAYSDAATLQLKYFSDLSKIQDDFAKSQADLEKRLANPNTSPTEKLEIQRQLDMLPDQAKRASEGMRQAMEKELGKLNMDKLFKDTMFSEMFQDLGNLSGKVLDQMLAKIRAIQAASNNLSLSQVRQLAQAAEKIENAKIDTASFKEAFDYIKKAYDLRKQGVTPKSASNDLADAQLKLDYYNQEIEDINLILGIKEKGYQIDEQGLVVGSERINLTARQNQLLQSSVQGLNNMLQGLKLSKEESERLVKLLQGYVNVFDNATRATQRLQTMLQKLGEVGTKGIEAITAGIEMFGGEVDDATQQWLDFVSSTIDSCITLAIQFVALGIEINSSLGIIGLIATALSVVAGLFQTILGAHDAKKEKQIKRLKDRVDDLKKAYDDLGDAIDRAYTMNDYKRGYNQSLNNLKQQEQAYREMMRLEEEKKKTDKDKIREYQDVIRDIEKTRKELQQDMYEDWGSVKDTNIRSEAENFVTAWLDAFKETGDGLDALTEHWDEFFENLVMKQASQSIVSARLDKYIKQINTAIEKGGGGLSLAQTFAQIGENLKAELGTWNEDLKAFFDAVGIKGGAGELLLSDLQKGIQNITEPQAAAIEAYLNSMRFAVFEQNNILTEMLTAIQAQYGGSTDNPILNEVKAIRSLVASIDNRLSKVIVGRNTSAGSYIVKVG